MTTKNPKYTGLGDIEHIQQLQRKASALLRVLQVAHNSEETLDHDDYTDVLELALRELRTLRDVALETHQNIDRGAEVQ